MVSVIHKPGWTTKAEVAFFSGIVDSMIAHAKALSSLKHVLLSGAAKVELNPSPPAQKRINREIRAVRVRLTASPA